MNGHELMERDLPCVYDVRFSPLNRNIIIEVTKEVADAVESKFIAHLRGEKTHIPARISQLQEDVGLGEFILPFSEQWGFGGCMHASLTESTVLWNFDLPKRTSSFGVEDDTFFKALFERSASLQLLMRVLNSIEVRQHSRSQLLSIDGIKSASGDYGCVFTVALSKKLCAWLVGQDNSSMESIGNAIKVAMLRAYQNFSVFGISQANDISFCVQLESGSKFVYLSCPGNACGFSPHDRADEDDNDGYELVPHNLDTPIQQFTLLAGISELSRYMLDSEKKFS